MPSIDYRRLRATISMEQVLELLSFEPTWRGGHQLRGVCPLPSCTSQYREFSVNIDRAIFRCFACGAHGSQLDLWAQAHQLPLHQAAKHLCEQTSTSAPLLPSPKH